MKRLSILVSTVALLAGCGMYTNLPAQIRVGEVKPAKVTFEKPDASGVREVNIEQGTVTLIGEPGSIGVTYEKMNIDYLAINESTVPQGELPPMDLRMSVRVGSSNFPGDVKGPLEQDKIGQTVQAGVGTFTVPVVTKFVEQYGLKTNVGALTAQVRLSGQDDAGLPADMVLYVPIVFHGGTGVN